MEEHFLQTEMAKLIFTPKTTCQTMIGAALTAIVKAINKDIGNSGPDIVELGNISLIDAFQDSSVQDLTDSVIVSVVNLQQESSLRNLPLRRAGLDEQGQPRAIEQAPEIYLNVYVLFGANLRNYDIALNRISDIIGFFQKHHVFTPASLEALIDDGSTVDLGLVRQLIFDLYSMSFEELNQLWSIIGGKYIPSVLYKMRMAIIQRAEETSAGVVEAIGATPNGL